MLVEVLVLVGEGDVPGQELGLDDTRLQGHVALGNRHVNGQGAGAAEDFRVVGADGGDLDAVKVVEGDQRPLGGEVIGVDDQREEKFLIVPLDLGLEFRHFLEHALAGVEDHLGITRAEGHRVGPIDERQLAGVVGRGDAADLHQPELDGFQLLAGLGEGTHPEELPTDAAVAAPGDLVGPPLGRFAHQKRRRRDRRRELQPKRLRDNRGGVQQGQGYKDADSLHQTVHAHLV